MSDRDVTLEWVRRARELGASSVAVLGRTLGALPLDTLEAALNDEPAQPSHAIADVVEVAAWPDLDAVNGALKSGRVVLLGVELRFDSPAVYIVGKLRLE